MRTSLAILAGLGLCFGPAQADTPALTRTNATRPPVTHFSRVTGIAGSWTIDAATGAVTAGRGGSRGYLVYDNTATSLGLAVAAGIGSELGDDLSLNGGGKLTNLGFSIYNDISSAGPLTQLDIAFKFYDRVEDAKIPGGAPTPYANFTLSNVQLAPPLEPGYAATCDVVNLQAKDVTLPIWTLATLTFTNVHGGASLLGQMVFHPEPPTQFTGESGDHLMLDGQYVNFGGPPAPWADLYFRLGVVWKSPPVLWDTGCAHTLVQDGVESYVGYPSGSHMPGQPQLWNAIPFYVGTTRITQINASWFSLPDQTGTTVKYVIWRRVGLERPQDGMQFAQGSLGPYSPGSFDRRIHMADDHTFHSYPVDIAIPAGDYYFTLYADGGQPGTNALAAWLTGGFLQPEYLEQQPDPPSFMWRSASFPNPGFVPFNITAMPGPELDQDEYADLYNCSFQLVGRNYAYNNPGDFNCDGFIDFWDVDPFVAVLSGAPCCNPTGYNCDVNGDGRIDFRDIDPFIALLSSGAT